MIKLNEAVSLPTPPPSGDLKNWATKLVGVVQPLLHQTEFRLNRVQPKDNSETMVIGNAVGDGVTDDGAAINVAIVAANALLGTGASYVTVDGGGLTYATSIPITVLSGVHLMNCNFIALAGSWNATTNGVVQCISGSLQKIENVFVDGNRITNTNGFFNSVQGTIRYQECRTLRCMNAGFYFTASASLTLCNAAQWASSDAEVDIIADRTAYGFYLNDTDFTLTRCQANYCLYPLYTDTNAFNTFFIGCHFFNGQNTGGPYVNAVNAAIHGNSAIFVGCYIDNGSINHYNASAVSPVLVFSGCRSVYSASKVTLTAWVIMDTNQVNANTKDLKIGATDWDTGPTSVVALTTSGGGSWATNANLGGTGAITDDVAMATTTFNMFNSGSTIDVMKLWSSHANTARLSFADKSTSSPTSNTPGLGSSGDDLILQTNGKTGLVVNKQVASAYAAITKHADATHPQGHHIQFTAATPNNTTDAFLLCDDPTNNKAIIWSNGDFNSRTGVYAAISDERLKRNIRDARPYLADLLRLKVRKFALDDDPSRDLLGLVAQEVEPVFPGLVSEDGKGTKALKASLLVPMLLSAVQEMAARIAALEEARA